MSKVDEQLDAIEDSFRGSLPDNIAWLLALCRRQQESLRAVHIWAKGRNKVAVIKMVQPVLEETE